MEVARCPSRDLSAAPNIPPVMHYLTATYMDCLKKFQLKTLTSENLSNFALCHPLPSTLAATYSPGCLNRLKLVELDPTVMLTNPQIAGRFQ